MAIRVSVGGTVLASLVVSPKGQLLLARCGQRGADVGTPRLSSFYALENIAIHNKSALAFNLNTLIRLRFRPHAACVWPCGASGGSSPAENVKFYFYTTSLCLTFLCDLLSLSNHHFDKIGRAFDV